MQRQALAIAEEIRLLDLRGDDEILDAREASADLERARWTFRHFDVNIDPVWCGPLFGGDVDTLEVAESRDADSGLLELGLAKLLCLSDFQFSANDLIARLGVSANLNALEMHQGAAHDRHDDVDLGLIGIEASLWVGVDIGEAVISVERSDLLEVFEERSTVEVVTGARSEHHPEIAPSLDRFDLAAVLTALVDA